MKEELDVRMAPTSAAIANAVPAALIVLDASGSVALANQRAERALGHARGGLDGQTVEQLLPARLHDDYHAARERFLAEPSALGPFPVTAVRADGEPVELEVQITPSRSDGDLLVSVVVEETPAQRRLEAQLAQAHKFESIGRLSQGVAHDFNNALTSINAYAHLVLSRLRPEDPSHADVRQIVRTTEDAGRLVTQLQAFGRDRRAQRETIDVNHALRNVSRLLVVVLGESVTLQLDLGGRLPGVEGDLSLFEQAAMQIALNARDAMPAGGHLTVTTSARADGRVEITFIDTGTGMDEQTRRRAFEPFFTTKPEAASRGLGLTTVFAFAEGHDGIAEIDSAPGAGTTVRLLLPAASPPPGTVPAVAGAGTVLMVEDESSLRRVVDRILTEEGYRVLVAASGEEALEIAAREPGAIDLLVSDVVLGGMTGPDLVTSLKARRPALKVLLMSGYAGVPIGPVDDFLPKPFSPFELARRIRRILRP